MNDAAKKLDTIGGNPFFLPARVLEYDEAALSVHVLLNWSEDKDKASKIWARLAIPFAYKPKWGETVLVAGEAPDSCYVIGVLNSQMPESESKKSLVLKSGVKAFAAGPPEAEKLQVFSKEGSLVFEYDAATGKSRVDIPTGDLEVVTRKGDIAFNAAKGIRFYSREPIEMESPEGIGLKSSNTRGSASSSLRLGPEKVNLSGLGLGIKAQRGDIEIDEARYLGKRLSGRITNFKVLIERLETVANNVIQKARNVYQTVEDLSQLRTGRMRTLIDETYQLKSKEAFLKAEGDFKIRGERIYLD